MPKRNEILVEINQERFMLEEDRHSKPSEIHKFITSHITSDLTNGDDKKSLLDMGCGVGNLIYHISNILPNFDYTGIDILEELLEKARAKMPTAQFLNVNILDKPHKALNQQYDFVVLCGVLPFFDDIKPVIHDTFKLVKEGGHLYIFNFFNEYPVDVISKYRIVDQSEFKSGWNIFSKKTYENILDEMSDVSYDWDSFNIGFDVEKKPDQYMRTWTVPNGNNPYQLTNGACQLINFSLLKAKKA